MIKTQFVISVFFVIGGFNLFMCSLFNSIWINRIKFFSIVQLRTEII